MNRICARPSCDKEIIGYKHKLFCSRYCKNENKKLRYRNKKWEANINRECKFCGKIFRRKCSSQVYCRKQCAKRAGRYEFLTSHRQKKLQGFQYNYRSAVRNFVDNYKLETGCMICGYSKTAYAMDLHHVVGEKLFTISQGWYFAPEMMIAEIEKCAILCANCHRELHAK